MLARMTPHTGPVMRVFRAVPRPGATEGVEANFATTSTALVKRQAGMVRCFSARPSRSDDPHRLFITVWTDWDALIAFAGPDPSVAVMPDGYDDLIESWEVEHYELLTSSDEQRS